MAMAALAMSAAALAVGISALKSSGAGSKWKKWKQKAGDAADELGEHVHELAGTYDEADARVERIQAVLRNQSDAVLSRIDSFIHALRKHTKAPKRGRIAEMLDEDEDDE